jgi:hypothetical protein
LSDQQARIKFSLPTLPKNDPGMTKDPQPTCPRGGKPMKAAAAGPLVE